MNDPLKDNIHLRLPIKIGHRALESFLREKLVGENIKTEENGKVTNYATILEISLLKSPSEEYDFSLALKLKTLTSLYRNKEAELLVDVAIEFDRSEQVVFVRDFNLEVETSNWLMENSLEALANTLLHGKLKNRMKFDFRSLLKEQLLAVNKKLESGLEIHDGISLSGFLSDFEVVSILPGEELLLAIVELEAKALLEVKQIKF